MQGDAGGSELTCRDGGAAAAWAMATEETRGRRGGVGGEARTDGRRPRRGEDGRAASKEEVESRSRGAETTRGISPGVSRPEMYPHENPAPTGPRGASGGLHVSRPVENRRVGFFSEEKAGIPPGFRAAKVGLSVQISLTRKPTPTA